MTACARQQQPTLFLLHLSMLISSTATATAAAATASSVSSHNATGDKLALLSVKSIFSVSGGEFQNWDDATPHCDWSGVSCSGSNDVTALNLRYLRLAGTLPPSLANLTNLRLLDLGFNKLSGDIPPELGSLSRLETLSLDSNLLSGEIPLAIANLSSLTSLCLSSNRLAGAIPPELQSLRSLAQLDLSSNSMSGNIPEFLGSLPLLYLNLCYNDFNGDMPIKGVFASAAVVSVQGNSKLCGGTTELGLPPCSSDEDRRRRRTLWSSPPLLVAVVAAIAVVACLLCFVLVRLRRRGSPPLDGTGDVPEGGHVQLSYADLFRATEGFSQANLIGSGSFGTVYKGVLDGGDEVAVKVLRLDRRGAARSFAAECEALRRARHRNLAGILTICIAADTHGDEFKAIVYEYFAGGSLDVWLHGGSGELSLLQRVGIAIDVASAVEYLHHGCPTTIVHCDLKPSNVLLGGDMTARVGDFGLARVFDAAAEIDGASRRSTAATSSVQLKGSIGYIAPEYGMGNRVSKKGDMYSFGILLLEMLTGDRPTDVLAGGGGLHELAKAALRDGRIFEVVDPELLSELAREKIAGGGRRRGGGDSSSGVEGCLASLLRVGVGCSSEMPSERAGIREVVKELHRIRVSLQKEVRWTTMTTVKDMPS